MSKLPEQTIHDLVDNANEKVNAYMKQAIQLVDDDEQRAVVATMVAAFMFGAATRLFQYSYRAKHDDDIEFGECLNAVTSQIVEIAKSAPPPPLPPR